MGKLKDDMLTEWRRREGKVYARADTLLQPGATFERRKPTRAPATSDVKTAIGWSLGTFGMCAFVGLVLALAKWDGRILVVGLVIGALLAGATWFLLLVQGQKLLWQLERVTQRDLDQDGHTGAPPAPPRQVRVEIDERHDGGARLRWIDLPVSNDKLADVARAVLVTGANFSRPGLSDVLSQNEYNGLAPAMVDAGLAVDLPGNRRELTAAGRAMLRKVLDDAD